MKKAPPNTPERGDRCRLRGRDGRVGRIVKLDRESNWCTVRWENDEQTICHRFELERIGA